VLACTLRLLQATALIKRVEKDIEALGGPARYAPGMRVGFAGDVAVSAEEIPPTLADIFSPLLGFEFGEIHHARVRQERYGAARAWLSRNACVARPSARERRDEAMRATRSRTTWLCVPASRLVCRCRGEVIEGNAMLVPHLRAS